MFAGCWQARVYLRAQTVHRRPLLHEGRTWLLVREMFFLRRFMANLMLDMSSMALLAKGLMQKAAKNAGIPDACTAEQPVRGSGVQRVDPAVRQHAGTKLGTRNNQACTALHHCTVQMLCTLTALAAWANALALPAVPQSMSLSRTLDCSSRCWQVQILHTMRQKGQRWPQGACTHATGCIKFEPRIRP